MKYVKITCPCKRPHSKKFMDDVSYVEEECNKLIGFIPNIEGFSFANHCTDCKKVIKGRIEDGSLLLEISDKRIITIEKQVVITNE